MSKRKKIIKNILTVSLVCTLSIMSRGIIANANGTSEDEFKSVIQSYSQEKVTVEDGISLYVGETKDFSEYPNWKLSNNNVVAISETGQVTAIGSGTVFLSQKIGDKVHVIEVYVPKNMPRFYSFYKSEPKSRDYYKVFVDAGHGGYDSGAPGFGKNEDELNLEVAKKVEQKLKSKNIQVQMSRESDVYLGIGERAQLANEYGADVFVSIHQNSADVESANGIETYYHPDKQMYKPLAVDIQTNAIAQTGARDRGVKDYRDLGVLRESNMPSALFESGFISNKQEYSKLIEPTYQDKLATAIANGVEKYLKDNITLNDQDLPVIDTGVVVDTTDLNVRSGYGTSYPVIGKIREGEKVEIVESKDGWYKIKYKESYGYVSGRYIKINSKLSFTDVDNHWAKSQILDFASKGYVNGYEDGTFRPENAVSRAEFVKMINKVLGFSEMGEVGFIDINKSDWYYNDICIGVKAGYINGYEDNSFRPNEPITREEASKIVAKVMNAKGDGVLGFTDKEQISDWAKEYVDALSDSNIINGYEDNTFRPSNNMTRAETVTILSRVEK
ncbi:MAG: N-acetylmuramoyl-L-alanine amidase [Peptostreptococcaceae bacterium]